MTIKKYRKWLLWVVLFYFFCFCPQLFAAISLLNFRASRDFSYNLLEGANFNQTLNSDRQGGELFLNFQYSYQDHPLIQTSSSGNAFNLVDSLNTLEIEVGFFLSRILALSLDVPVNAVAISRDSTHVGLGDLNLQAKIFLGEITQNLGFALIPSIDFPIGNSNYFLSTQSFGGNLLGAAELKLGKLKLVANLGYQFDPSSKWYNVDTSNTILTGIGANFEIFPRFQLNAEGIGSFGIPMSSSNNHGEYHFGARYQFLSSWVVFAGASYFGIGSSNQGFSGIGGVKWITPAAQTNIVEKYLSDCGEKPVTARFFVRPLTEKEMSKKDMLPYRSTEGDHDSKYNHPIPAIQVGQMTGVTSGGIPYVRSSQVLFAVDLVDLPPRKSIVEVGELSLKMGLRQVVMGKYIDTEILCFLDEKICSGELYRDKYWLKNINQEFFKEKKPLMTISSSNIQVAR